MSGGGELEFSAARAFNAFGGKRGAKLETGGDSSPAHSLECPRVDRGASRGRVARLREALGHTGRAGHDYDPCIEQQLARHERVRCEPEHAYSTWYGDDGVHAAVRGLAASDQPDWRTAAPCRSNRLSADDAIGGDSRVCGSGGRVDIAGGPSSIVAHDP